MIIVDHSSKKYIVIKKNYPFFLPHLYIKIPLLLVVLIIKFSHEKKHFRHDEYF